MWDLPGCGARLTFPALPSLRPDNDQCAVRQHQKATNTDDELEELFGEELLDMDILVHMFDRSNGKFVSLAATEVLLSGALMSAPDLPFSLEAPPFRLRDVHDVVCSHSNYCHEDDDASIYSLPLPCYLAEQQQLLLLLSVRRLARPEALLPAFSLSLASLLLQKQLPSNRISLKK